jgi:KDO2-lipid IV(A) lauroyltransferase
LAAKNRQWRWRFEAALARGLVALSRRMGMVRASALGGAICRHVGPLLPVSRIGRRNLEIAFPDRTPQWREETLRDAWENLGRVMLEWPHVADLRRTESGPGWEAAGEENIPPPETPCIFISAHLSNWELMQRPTGASGRRMAGFYRAPDNPLVDELVQSLRGGGDISALFPKGARGARMAMKHLGAGHSMGILVDQKMNEGLALPFFGQPAMTPTGPAELALRFGCVVVPCRTQRIGPCRYRVVFEAPLPLPDTGDRAADVRSLALMMNQTLERWLREQPGEWLWLHRRFPREVYRR